MFTCKLVTVASSLKLWVVEVLKFICFLSLDSTELPPTVQKKGKKRKKEARGNQDSARVLVFLLFSGEVKSTSKELRLKYNKRDLPGLVLVRVSCCSAPGQQPRPASSRQSLSHTSMLSTTLDTINMGQRFRPRGPNEGHKQQGEVLNEEPCKDKQSNSPTECFCLPNVRGPTSEPAELEANWGCFRCPLIILTHLLTPASTGRGLFPCKVDDTVGKKTVKWRFCSSNRLLFFLAGTNESFQLNEAHVWDVSPLMCKQKYPARIIWEVVLSQF